tara:strand:+ start:645 stop:1877 length:1233 start_codon:yes stop_codon:yes gene_type:complete
MQTATTHFKNGEYIETIEVLRKNEKWTEDTMNMMAKSNEKLHRYETAFLYYTLAKNTKDASRVIMNHPKQELETEYSDYINPKCRILRVKDRRGVFAMDFMDEGEVLLKIPLSECKRGTQEELAKYLLEDNVYSRSMPVTKFPVEWSEELKDELNVSPMRLILERRINQMSKDNVHELSLVGSRNFANGKDEYLVPFADMLNHSNKPNIEWKFTDSHFVMKTTKDIKPHEECFDCYGPKSNYELFLHYGFVLPCNTHLDKVRVICDIPGDIYAKRVDPRYFQRSFEFELMGSYMEGTVEIFSFLRYLRSKNRRCPETIKQFIQKPIDKENELWACKMLFNWLQADVKRRVEKSAYGVENPLTISLLQSEMSVLVHWGETLQLAISILSGNRKAAKKSKNDYIIKVVKKLI